MSASSKKKLRKDQDTAKLTEKQLTEQKEAKKLKAYTIAFVAALALMLVVAIVIGVNQAVSNSGIREKNTVAVTIGDHEISNAELSYFYINVINQNSSYMSYFLDTTKSLDEQYIDEEAGTTWADYFIDTAKSNAKEIYAIADAAQAAGYTLPEDAQAEVDSQISTLALYAYYYGYSDVESYLKAMFGKGASEEGYRAYLELTSLASSYYTAYGEGLSYTDADLRAAEADNFSEYSSYSYHSYYLSASKFLTGGTTDEDGNTTYSDEEKAASVESAKQTAESLIVEDLTSVEDLDSAIAALAINAESTTAKSSSYEDTLYTSVNSMIREWVTDETRESGDRAVIPSESTSTDDDGNTVTTTNGYYVVWFEDSTDNTFALKNVRHILVAFEGGTTDDSGNTTYSDEEKSTAKLAAEELLSQWKNGDANEESFAALANLESDDTGSNTNGGLYEDIYPGQMVETFNDWCYEDGRTVGDTGIVETSYGYHVMYFVGDSDMNYRDYLIESELRSAELSDWYSETVEAINMVDGNTKYMSKDLVLSSN